MQDSGLSEIIPLICTSALWGQYPVLSGFLGGSDSKESACSAGYLSWIPGLGRSLGEGNGSPLQYSCLENSMDRGAWWATVHWGLKESDITE